MLLSERLRVSLDLLEVLYSYARAQTLLWFQRGQLAAIHFEAVAGTKKHLNDETDQFLPK